MEALAGSAQAELLGVLADLVAREDLAAASWLGPEAWEPCPLEVAGGLWIGRDAGDLDDIGPIVAEELERRSLGRVYTARRVLPGEGTVLVWYRHLN